MTLKPNESNIQSLLMHFAMESAGHVVVLPNPTPASFPRIVRWESDLVSINRSGFFNEYEIKISRSDYLRDQKKLLKISELSDHYETLKKYKKHIAPVGYPNYFWYVTAGFEIEPPAWSGWILITEEPHTRWDSLSMKIIKKAPRLHNGKVGERQYAQIAKLISYRLNNAHRRLHPFISPKDLEKQPQNDSQLDSIPVGEQSKGAPS